MSVENTIREQMKKAGEAPSLEEAYPGFGKNKEASSAPQGSSVKPNVTVTDKGAGSAAAIKAAAATSLSPSSGPMETKPLAQGSSNANPEKEDLGTDEPGKVASAKMKKTTGIPVGRGHGAARGFTDYVNPATVVNQSSSKGNVAQEDVVLTQDEYDSLSEEEKSAYEAIITEDSDDLEDYVLTADEYDSLSDEEKEEYEAIITEDSDDLEDYVLTADEYDSLSDEEKEEYEPVVTEDVEEEEAVQKQLLRKEQLDTDIASLFGDNTELSEDFKNKTASLFEAVIEARIADLRGEIEEEASLAAGEIIADYVEEMTERVDAYLNYVVENWLEENQVPVVENLRNEVTEEFMEGLRTLFIEHNIDVPESKFDLVAEMQDKINELEEQVNLQISEAIDLTSVVADLRREVVVSSITEGLAATEVEKFRTLIENVSFEDEVTFEEKLGVIRNSYFPKSPVVPTSTLDEEVDGSGDEVEVTEGMKKYVDVLGRGITKF